MFSTQNYFIEIMPLGIVQIIMIQKDLIYITVYKIYNTFFNKLHF